MNRTLEVVLLSVAAGFAVLSLLGVAAKVNLLAWGLLIVAGVMLVPLVF